MIERSVIVAGAGPAGLVSACLLAQNGWRVTCVSSSFVGDDPRTVALMDPSLRLLTSLGVWSEQLKQYCAPLVHLHIRDDTGHMFSAPHLKFSACEAGLSEFGWNVPLNKLLPSLVQTALELGVELVSADVNDVELTDHSVTVLTNTGQSITASIAVAADGRNSILRTKAGIATSRWSFEQGALVTRFHHSRPHESISTEWHRKGGPFTTVPLPGNMSALVWMDTPDHIQAAMQLGSSELARDIQLNTHGTLGLISNVAAPESYAMQGVKAERFAAKRVFLVGEAAHVFPPIGAQGLNMSMRDCGHVLDVMQAHDDPGSEAAMQDYNNCRAPDVGPRQTAITMMNRSLLAETMPMHLARAAGLTLAANIPMLRRAVMAQSLAPESHLPHSMR
jgi:2-octaprenyl-6-methoxyphenol hydroxylase